MKKLHPIGALIAVITLACNAHAQTAPAAQPDMNQQLQKLLSKNKNKDAMGQTIATGVMLGCINKKVGKDATQAFYQEMQTVGKTVQSYCNEGHATEARTLVLTTLDAKRNDPVMQGAIECYDTQHANLDSMAGPRVAADAAKYANWARDPVQARNEMKTTDICRQKQN